MAATTTLLTVEAYSKIADPPGGRFELRHGELALVPPPAPEHARIQDLILELLLSRREASYHVSKEFAFRPLPEYEVWIADLGVIRKSVWNTLRREWLGGSPEIVIEVLSPSNTAQEMIDRERTCFDGGCQQFWVVDPNRRIVKVSTPDGHSITYEGNAEIPLAPYGQPVRVSEIFEA